MSVSEGSGVKSCRPVAQTHLSATSAHHAKIKSGIPQESTYRTAAIVCCGRCLVTDLHRYRRAFAWIAAISAQHLDVLDGGREVFLNSHTPQAAPSCLVKPETAGAHKGALDQVLARTDIAPGLRRAWLVAGDA